MERAIAFVAGNSSASYAQQELKRIQFWAEHDVCAPRCR